MDPFVRAILREHSSSNGGRCAHGLTEGRLDNFKCLVARSLQTARRATSTTARPWRVGAVHGSVGRGRCSTHSTRQRSSPNTPVIRARMRECGRWPGAGRHRTARARRSGDHHRRGARADAAHGHPLRARQGHCTLPVRPLQRSCATRGIRPTSGPWVLVSTQSIGNAGGAFVRRQNGRSFASARGRHV